MPSLPIELRQIMHRARSERRPRIAPGAVPRWLMPWVAGSAVALACLSGLPAAADTISLVVAKDASLYEEDDLTANGGGQYIFAGNTDNAETRRALLEFDLSPIPPGSTINSATLTL